MTKQRYISTTFWKDEFVGELEPLDKLLYMYLLTGGQTNIAGVYKIQMREIMFDTGLSRDQIQTIFQKLEKQKKAKYVQEYVIIAAWPKHQKWQIRRNIHTGIRNILMGLPKTILDECQAIGYEYPLDTLSKPMQWVLEDMVIHPEHYGINPVDTTTHQEEGGAVPEEPPSDPEDPDYSDINSDSDLDFDSEGGKNSLPPETAKPPPGKPPAVGPQGIPHDLGGLITQAIDHWNALAEQCNRMARYRFTVLNMRDPPSVRRVISVYSIQEVRQAMANYRDIANNPGTYELFPEYSGFEGFMKSGVEKYCEEANPQERCRREDGDDPSLRAIEELRKEQEDESTGTV